MAGKGGRVSVIYSTKSKYTRSDRCGAREPIDKIKFGSHRDGNRSSSRSTISSSSGSDLLCFRSHLFRQNYVLLGSNRAGMCSNSTAREGCCENGPPGARVSAAKPELKAIERVGYDLPP